MIENPKKILVFGLFLSISALITFFVLMSFPSDPKNAVFVGYSFERIILGGGVLAFSVVLLFVAFGLRRDTERSQRIWFFVFQQKKSSDRFLIVAISIFLATWVLLFLPSYRLGSFASYLARLYPVLAWFLLVNAATILVILVERILGNAHQFINNENKNMLKVGTIVFAVLLILASFAAISGMGLSSPEDYWYGAGVPVLGLQILVSVFAGITFIFLEKKIKLNKKYLDFILFVLIWGIAAIFWSHEPLSPNYFMPDTSDNPIYPYSDSITFDLGAQYALIGQGIFNGMYFDRVLYSIFLVYLHLFFGQDLNALMTAQAIFFSIFPAIVYLIGKELHSRALGISAGCLMLIRGVNAIISSKWIDTASPKMMLTDFPTAIGIALFLLFLLKWSKQSNKIEMLALAGATFGWALMFRTHNLILLPIAIIFILLIMKGNFRNIILLSGVLLLGLLAATLPWEIRNQSKGTPMFYMYYYRIEILLRERYGIDSEAQQSIQGGDFSGQHVAANSFKHLKVIFQTANDKKCSTKACAISNHFFHNYITSFASIPSSFTYDDLWNTVKIKNPFWKNEWDVSDISRGGLLLISSNLFLISLGFGSLWLINKFRAFLPVVVFFAYILVNSLGFTSGGRYIVPVDWIIYVYYLLGVVQVVIWLLDILQIKFDKSSSDTTISSPVMDKKFGYRLTSVLSLLIFIGLLLPLSDFLSPKRYQVNSENEILLKLEEQGLLSQSGFTKDELITFLEQPNAVVREGRSLYPRYYPSNEGESDNNTHYMILDYPRLVFTIIGPKTVKAEGVIIPGDRPKLLMHAKDTVVFGCSNTTFSAPFIDAIVVFFTSEDGYVYTRSPGAPLQCPLPEPN